MTEQDAKEFFQELSLEMKSQDNRGTASPYALIIGQKEIYGSKI